MRSPMEMILECVDVPEGLRSLLPRRWERIGDVLLLKLDDRIMPHARAVAEAYSEVLGVRAVLRDLGVYGPYRTPRVERILGEDTETWHRENGVLFRIDPARVIFSSGNIDERIRMATIASAGERVVDMFAGIGYFIVPMALHSGVTGWAYEINPVSHRFLVETLRANGVEDRVTPVLANCMDAPEGVADRVIVGYLSGTDRYLEKAMRIVRPGGGLIHCHMACPVELIPERPMAIVESAAGKVGGEAEIVRLHEVKSYAPGVDHIVLDIRFNTA
ncbi:MAG TPA: class I SAM-dependent methyltransferase family protein [Thermoplasmata archaeon]|nr:class I SAM-dependent methyltransferase family protein [Thermoplasmata archaeon]